MDNEITVLVNCSYEELHNQLLLNNFEIKEEFELHDDYMIDKSVDIIANMDKREILSKCILVRNVVGIWKGLVYKNKKYAPNGDIIGQSKVQCPIEDIDAAIKFMEAINYKKLFHIYDKSIVYSNDKTEFVVQIVGEYIFIEMEQECEHINKKYNTIEQMKAELDSYNLPYYKNDYFVKKAEIILDKMMKN